MTGDAGLTPPNQSGSVWPSERLHLQMHTRGQGEPQGCGAHTLAQVQHHLRQLLRLPAHLQPAVLVQTLGRDGRIC
jgi:hypothetical protein